MKISYNWLKDYIEITKTPEQLADDLSLFGHEVESTEKRGDDTILDFEITPNRGDCLSILGMAREIAALYNSKLKIQNSKLQFKTQSLDKKIDVKISDAKICPRYTARIIDNIEIKESPKWMQERLATYGFRPINNIVDITNYVMVATGQPLHAFDYDKIKDGKFNIRLSKKDEEVITLDGINRKLNGGTIIIEDDEKIYDLAGIMGGLKSEVDQNTKTIVLQGAIFDPVMVRQTAKYLNHTTDASYRYERGVDYEGNIHGVDMAASLIAELISDAKIGQLIDIKSQPLEERNISYDPIRINRLLGTNLSDKEIKANLSRLNFVISDSSAKVPSYRLFDVKIWQDLAEEVARIHGYNNLGKINLDLKKAEKNKEFTGREKLKDRLVELGFTEVYSYSFADKNKLAVLGFDPQSQPQIEKPLSPETEYLRPSILPSLLSVIAKNPWSPDVNIFEMEAVFAKETEKWQLGMATVGKSDALLKSALEKLDHDASIDSVDQKILDSMKIRRPVKYTLIDIDKIKLPTGDYTLETSEKKYQPISKFPPTVRDLAFIVKSDVKASEIICEIKNVDEKILIVELFDEYTSEKIGKEKKNMAFHIWIQDLKKPLDEAKAKEVIKEIIGKISIRYDARLRAR